MKKIKNLPESAFLMLFFGFIAGFFLIGSVCMPDRGNLLSGYGKILTSTCKISTNYFALGGYAATFFNMGTVALFCLALFAVLKAPVNQVSTLAFLLTLGFGSWGIHILNILPSILGVVLSALVKREKLSANANAMLFSTGIAPLISDLMLRYPNAEAVGFNPLGLILALGVGLLIGFITPAGLVHSPKVHKGFDLYSAALPIGMTAFFLQAVLFKTMGVALPAAPAGETLKVASRLICNIFCGTLFGLCILLALLMGCKPKQYWALLKDPALVTNFSSTYGNEVFLMNVGVFGLFILGYYNLIGATFNGVTLGVVFCMLATCNSGSHPANVWPIMLAYVVTSSLFGWLSGLLGGTFANAINAQAIVVGLCYANGLSPIADKYGWRFGFLAGAMHYLLVTSVPNLHGGYCLYNGGFTAALICLILMPILERHTRDKFQRKEARLARKAQGSLQK